MSIEITLPESGKTFSVESFTRGQVKKLGQLLKDNPKMSIDEYWEAIITEALPDVQINDDWKGADIAHLAKTIMAYSTGGPDSIKN